MKEWIEKYFKKHGKWKKGTITVLIFVCLLFVFLFREARSETVVQAGASVVQGNFTQAPVLIIQERFADDKYALALGYIGSQTAEGHDVQEQLIVGAERLIRGNFDEWTWFNRVTLSVGAYWFSSETVVSSARLNARLGLTVDITPRFAVMISHFSNAGTGEKIPIATSGKRICAQDRTYCYTETNEVFQGPFNKGQDALLLQWRF